MTALTVTGTVPPGAADGYCASARRLTRASLTALLDAVQDKGVPDTSATLSMLAVSGLLLPSAPVAVKRMVPSDTTPEKPPVDA